MFSEGGGASQHETYNFMTLGGVPAAQPALQDIVGGPNERVVRWCQALSVQRLHESSVASLESYCNYADAQYWRGGAFSFDFKLPPLPECQGAQQDVHRGPLRVIIAKHGLGGFLYPPSMYKETRKPSKTALFVESFHSSTPPYSRLDMAFDLLIKR